MIFCHYHFVLGIVPEEFLCQRDNMHIWSSLLYTLCMYMGLAQVAMVERSLRRNKVFLPMPSTCSLSLTLFILFLFCFPTQVNSNTENLSVFYCAADVVILCLQCYVHVVILYTGISHKDMCLMAENA